MRAVDALRIYFDRVSAAGGINGNKVNLIIQDDPRLSLRRLPPMPRSC